MEPGRLPVLALKMFSCLATEPHMSLTCRLRHLVLLLPFVEAQGSSPVITRCLRGSGEVRARIVFAALPVLVMGSASYRV